MKIILFNPTFLDGARKNLRVHSYIIEYIKQSVDVIYSPNFFKIKFYKQKLKELGIHKNIRFVSFLIGLNSQDYAMVGFSFGSFRLFGINNFKGKKFFHLMDYYIDIARIHRFLTEGKVDYVICHGQLDKNSDFFNFCYPEYNGKVVSLPFGYAERFCYQKPFAERQKLAVGLGCINLMRDQKLSDEQTREMRSFFPDRIYQHEVRAFLRDNEKDFEECIKCYFPSDEQQKDFSYDAVERMNDYQMFINDAGFSGFPPGRTYEGIASGCVMVAAESEIYSDLGFINGINYIGYPEGNYDEMRRRINYYIQHQDELYMIQQESMKLAKKFDYCHIIAEFSKKIDNLVNQ